jgi:cytochrome c oxidase subunit 1
VPFFWNVYQTWKSAPLVTVDDPWGYGASLEWATSCPPPRHNFASLPRIRSERPAFDLHHPEISQFDVPTEDKNLLDRAMGEPEMERREDGLNSGHEAEGQGNQGVQDT